MAKGIGSQPASLGLSRQGTLKCTPKKNEKKHTCQKIPPIKKRHTSYSYTQLLLTRWWPGTPWPLRFAPICEELHAHV